MKKRNISPGKTATARHHKRDTPKQTELDSLIASFSAARLKEAETTARQLTDRYPAHAFGWKALGTILVKQNRDTEALPVLKKARVLLPDDGEIFNSLGTALHHLGSLEEALTNFDQALKIIPGYAEAYNNKGIIFYDLGRLEEALANYNKALEIKPVYVEALNNKGTALTYLNRVEEALKDFDRALQIKPNDSNTYENLIELYETTNQMDALNRIIASARKTIPGHDCISYGEALLLRYKGEHEKARQLLETIDLEKMPLKKQKKYTSFLASVCDRAGRHDAAYHLFLKSNALAARTPLARRIDKNSFHAFIDSLMQYFTPAKLSDWTSLRRPPENHAPVFLTGFPRSGTTLLDTVLHSHPEIEVVEEKPTVEAMINELRKQKDGFPDSLTSLEPGLRQQIRESYFQELNKFLKNQGSLVVDKNPLNNTRAGIIHRIFPEARFIFVQRHPCDCVLSCFMQDFGLNVAMVNFLDLNDAAKLYDKVMTLWFRYCDLFNLQAHTIIYEDMIADFDKTIGPLLEFLNLDWDPALLDYRTTALKRGKINTPSYNQVTQPLYTHAKGRWENYKEQMAPVLPVLLPWAERLGYSV